MNDDDSLNTYLSRCPCGELSSSTTDEVESLLQAAWSTFEGAQAGGMQAYKLAGRVENLCWQPPVLTFGIERHGAIVGGGSTRAECQHWQVDLSTWTAMIVRSQRRQLYPSQPRLDVEPLAERIANAIVSRRPSESLKWYPDGRVKVLIGTLIPDEGVKQTVATRRKRFSRALDKRLATEGWIRVAVHVYQRNLDNH